MRWLMCSFVLAVAAMTSAAEQHAEIQVLDDTHIRADFPSMHFANATRFTMRRSAAGVANRQVLLRFDFENINDIIGAGNDITRAYVVLREGIIAQPPTGAQAAGDDMVECYMVTDGEDVDQWRETWSWNTFNGELRVSDGDLDPSTATVGQLRWAGDADRDGDVDSTDLTEFGLNEGLTGGWTEAEFESNNTIVNNPDLNEIGTNWQKVNGPNKRSPDLCIDITEIAQAWEAGAANNGVCLMPLMSGVRIQNHRTSNNTEASLRPVLLLYFDEH